ncbi:hypothetical protein FH972_010936 [Carpinus fangiana]|uniref:Uncharacterized protein n=1 Tax=Carpinus fangiana TaxID=176857 RepID=A0A660KSW2_9ROSI|nr:hypothetical protein FH972_010936 [Carpinus fangiana]
MTYFWYQFYSEGPGNHDNCKDLEPRLCLEAQRAAEKAFEVGKMDERVNKAVAAANKAATAARVVAVKAVQNQMHPSDSNNGTPILSV